MPEITRRMPEIMRRMPEIMRDFLAGTLALDRAREFTEQLRVAGVPV